MDGEDLDLTELYQEIVDKGCCKRCALRYLGYSRTLISFDSPDTSLITFGLLSPLEELNLVPPTKKKKTSPCAVCLGLLEDEVLEEMLSHEALKKCAEYKHKTFIPYITFPVNILVRDHSMKFHLKRTFPQLFDASKAIKVNQAWRYTVEQRLGKVLGKECDPQKSNFSIHFYTQYLLEEEEMNSIQEYAPVQRLGGRQTIMDFLVKLDDHEMTNLLSVPPRPPFYAVTLKDLKFFSQNIHILGKYCKYARDLMQTQNPHNRGPNIAEIVTKAATDSTPGVKEAIFQVANCDETQVRILGEGRTFHLELVDPKFEKMSRGDCRRIEKRANKCGLLRIKTLRQSHKKAITAQIDSENVNPRTCKLLCIVTEYKNLDYCINAINMYQGLTVRQKTPIRVLHQRACWTRKKKIFYIKAKKLRDNLIEVEICAETGLYLYEFINGDLGRTKPSMGDIMKAKVDVVVMDIVRFQVTASYAADMRDVITI